MLKKIILLCSLITMVTINAIAQELSVEKGVIYCKSGIPEMPPWFADSRLSSEVCEHGTTRVEYFYKNK